MSTQLSDMTLKELWQLFPIYLTEHNDCWEDWYNDEKNNIISCIDLKKYRISHIGSTAIKLIKAKPIIDILVEIPTASDIKQVKFKLQQNGYICMCEEKLRIDFNKGYTPNGFAEKVFHLHLRYKGDNDELYFRDYMNENYSLALQYENLKLKLWKQFEHNRDAYTDGKSTFINEYTRYAKKLYENRYE